MRSAYRATALPAVRKAEDVAQKAPAPGSERYLSTLHFKLESDWASERCCFAKCRSPCDSPSGVAAIA